MGIVWLRCMWVCVPRHVQAALLACPEANEPCASALCTHLQLIIWGPRGTVGFMVPSNTVWESLQSILVVNSLLTTS